MAAGNWIPEMVEIAGGYEVSGRSGNNSHWIKFNEIKDYDPEIIIFLPCGFDIKKTKKELTSYLKKNSKWSLLKAFKNDKLFIVDGNSNEKTKAILKKYNNHPNINITYLKKNKRAGFCRNFAIRKTKSEYIAFIDSDDIWEKE